LEIFFFLPVDGNLRFGEFLPAMMAISGVRAFFFVLWFLG
jgi:hypothetical protein